MSRKRKRERPPPLDTFTFSAAEVAHGLERNALATMEHVEGSKVVRQTAVVAAPMPKIQRPQRDFEDIQDLLGNDADVQSLQHSDEVTHHYIQGPGRLRANHEKRAAGQFATNVRLSRVYLPSSCRCVLTSNIRPTILSYKAG